MNKTKIIIGIKLVFLIIFCVAVYLHKQNSPRILIIHSYADDYTWVQEMNVGIRRFFDKHRDYTLRFHYMDLKNHGDPDFRRTSQVATLNTIEKWNPDIIMLYDDAAQLLVGMNYLDHPKIKVVFGGVNGLPSTYKYDQSQNVTGILERKPLKAVEETSIMLFESVTGLKAPNVRPRIVLLGDSSDSFKAGLSDYTTSNHKWKSVEWVQPRAAITFEEWKSQVLQIDKEADVLLVSDYRQLKVAPDSKVFVSAKEVVKWTEENSPVPVLGLASVYTQDGGGISVAVSGYEQGEVSANQAYKITTGERASAIAIAPTSQFLISMRKSTLEKKQITLPPVYEAFARATNNFYE
jgi:hypothetical protein